MSIIGIAMVTVGNIFCLVTPSCFFLNIFFFVALKCKKIHLCMEKILFETVICFSNMLSYLYAKMTKMTFLSYFHICLSLSLLI